MSVVSVSAPVFSSAVPMLRPRLVQVAITSSRFVSLSAGIVALGAGVAAIVSADVGAGAGDVFVGGLAPRLGVAHGTAGLFVGAVFLFAALVMRVRPGFAAVAVPVAITPVVNFGLTLAPSAMPAPVAFGVAFAGLVSVAFGVGAICVSGLGRPATELLVATVAARTGRSEVLLRTGLELSFVACGVALGGPLGPFTVVCAVLIGPSIGAATRVLSRVTGIAATSVNVRWSRL